MTNKFASQFIIFSAFFCIALAACNSSGTTSAEADTSTMQAAPDTSMQMMQDTSMMMDTSEMDTASTRPIRHPNK